MSYLVDGNNVMAQRVGWHRDKPGARRRLLGELARFARDADERIKGLVEASRERRTLKVVTSDRALADYVRRCGAEVIRSGEFRRRLDAAASDEESEQGGEHEGLKSSELDEWMYYFGVSPD